MNSNLVVTSGEQISAFVSENYGVVCSEYCVESVNIEKYPSGPATTQIFPATAQIFIKGVNPRLTTLEKLGVERPASELSVDELMKIVYQKLDQRQ